MRLCRTAFSFCSEKWAIDMRLLIIHIKNYMNGLCCRTCLSTMLRSGYLIVSGSDKTPLHSQIFLSDLHVAAVLCTEQEREDISWKSLFELKDNEEVWHPNTAHIMWNRGVSVSVVLGWTSVKLLSVDTKYPLILWDVLTPRGHPGLEFWML